MALTLAEFDGLMDQGRWTSQGFVIATGISADDYMDRFAELFCEWVDGNVVKTMSSHVLHDGLSQYLKSLLGAYFALRPIARMFGGGFLMKSTSLRQPDIQILRNENRNRLTPYFVDGAADICIEIVADDSIARDYGEKFQEYEAGGVHEYWNFYPLRNESRFYRLDDQGIYRTQKLDADGNYQTPLLPGLVIHEPDIWRSPLPDILKIVESVKAMLAK